VRIAHPSVLLGPCVLLALGLLLTGCGGSAGDRTLEAGTVALLNQSDLGQAPLTIEQFFLQPIDVREAGPNLLHASLPPGGVVILGLYPPGAYNAIAVLEGGLNVNFQDVEVRPGQPTNFIVP